MLITVALTGDTLLNNSLICTCTRSVLQHGPLSLLPAFLVWLVDLKIPVSKVLGRCQQNCFGLRCFSRPFIWDKENVLDKNRFSVPLTTIAHSVWHQDWSTQGRSYGGRVGRASCFVVCAEIVVSCSCSRDGSLNRLQFSC